MSFVLTPSAAGPTIGSFEHIGVPHGVATRSGGVSAGCYASLNLGPRSGDDLGAVKANRSRFRTALGVGPEVRSLAPRQVHSAEVAVHVRGDPDSSQGVYDGDGLVTDDPDVMLTVLAADCAAVLLHDPKRSVVAALHAGWRGTAGAIAVAGVRAMSAAFGCHPADIRAGIGPAICFCCYEVGTDVAGAVARATPGTLPYERRENGKAHLDITTANVTQLTRAGLDPANIVSAGICTACRTDLFYSHRREGEPTGRFGAAICMQT
ncbi:MAG: peptidoglycan editing factor PgeF [Dehalococcoidia bacterium]